MDKAKLVWNVFRENINSRQIEIHNVFDHYSFRESLKKLFKAKLTKEEFAEQLRREISYYYWTKVEWEITIASYPTYIDRAEFERLMDEREKHYSETGKYPYSNYVNYAGAKRVDVYDQIMLNWDAFVNYVWEHKGEKL